MKVMCPYNVTQICLFSKMKMTIPCMLLLQQLGSGIRVVVVVTVVVEPYQGSNETGAICWREVRCLG